MQMNFVRAALLACGVTAAMMTAPSLAADKPAIAPSSAVSKQLQAAQKLLAAGDFKSALDQVHAAQAATGRTPEDDYLINEFVANISIKLNDYPTATTAFEAMADSPVLDKDPDKVSTLSNAMVVANNAKDYTKTLAYGQKLQSIQPLTGNQLFSMTTAYYFTNDFAHAKELAEKSIAEAKAAGKIPERGILQILMNCQTGLKDQPAAQATLEELAADYNEPGDWQLLIDVTISNKGTDIDALNLFRLGIVTGASLDSNDYSLMGSIALKLAFAGDAVAAAQHGGKAPGASAKAAADNKELPGLIAAAKNQDARHNMVLAEDLYGYGRYAEAEESARRALSKGGSADEANMLIGMSLVGEGKYSDAVATFQQIGGGTPRGTKTAHLWLVYAQRKAAPPPAASAPAH
jgi:tetratricopeptide (TPR) repeat protein